MRIPFWFLVGLFIVALMAAFEAAPRLLLLGPGGPRPGSLLDNGSLGMAELAGMLEQAGASLGVGVEPPRDWSGPIVYLIAGPMSCSSADAAALAEIINRIAESGRVVGLVVASSGNYSCGRLVAAAVAGSAPVTLEQAPGLYLVLPGGPVRGPFVLYAPDRVEPVTAWRPVAVATGMSRDRLPGVLALETPLGVRIVYIPDWPVFSNALVRAEKQAGLDPSQGFMGLFAYAAGGSLRDVLVLQPTVFLPQPKTPSGIILQPGVALARAAEEYAKAEQTLYQRLIYNPFAVLVAAMVAAAVYYVASLGPGDRGVASTREKPSEAEAAPRAASLEEALAALQEATRIALGASPASVAVDDRMLRRLAAAAGVDPASARKALIAAETGKPPRLGRGRVRDTALALVEALASWAATGRSRNEPKAG